MDDLDPIEQAKANGYVRSTDPDVRRRWWVWCKIHDEPYLEVEDRMFYAKVNLDTISCENRVLTREGAQRIRTALYQHAEPFGTSDERSVRGGTSAPHPGMSIWCERIPRAKAGYVARLLGTIVKQEMVVWDGEGTIADYVPAL